MNEYGLKEGRNIACVKLIFNLFINKYNKDLLLTKFEHGKT